MERLTGLFFDLDGTLVDSERHHWRAWCAALRPFRIGLSWQLYRDEGIGHPDPEILQRIARLKSNDDVLRAPADVLRAKEKHFIQSVKKISPMSRDIVRLLEQIGGLPLAVVTSSPHAEVGAILERARVAQFFTTVVCLHDVRTPKPHPEPYLIAMERLQVEQGIAFEDSESGKMSAAAAGLEVIAVPGPKDLPSLVRSRLSAQVCDPK